MRAIASPIGSIGDRHVERIGVQQRRAIAHDRDMALPEDQIAAARCSIVDRRAERLLLHVAVARAGDAAGLQRDLHQAGAVDAVVGLAAPEIGRAEETFRDRDEVLLDMIERREVARRQIAGQRDRETILLARHRDAAAERRRSGRRQLDRRSGKRERAQRRDLVRRRGARRDQGVRRQVADIAVGGELAPGPALVVECRTP